MTNLPISHFFQPFSIAETQEMVEEPFIQPQDVVSDTKSIQSEIERHIMLEHLVAGGIRPSTRVTLENLAERLQKACVYYDAKTIKGIFWSLSDSNAPGTTITAEDFVDAYLKRKEEVTSILKTTQNEYDATIQMLNDAELQLQNPNEGDYDPSRLTVQVVSIESLEEQSLYKVQLECQRQIIQTKEVYSNQGGAFYNEMFSFEILAPGDELKISLIEIDHMGREFEIGESSIQIESLNDQRKHDFSKALWDSSAEIILSCQWIYSKPALYASYYKDFLKKKDVIGKKLQNYRQEIMSLTAPLVEQKEKNGLENIMQAAPEYLSKSIDKVFNHFQLSSWQVALQYMLFLTFLFSCVASFTRCLYLDQTMASFALWCNLEPKRWSVPRISLIMLALLGSGLLDIFWLRIYFNSWASGSIEAELEMFSQFFCLAFFAWKIMLFFLFWKCQYELHKELKYKQRMTAFNKLSQVNEMIERNGAPLVPSVSNALKKTSKMLTNYTPLLSTPNINSEQNKINAVISASNSHASSGVHSVRPILQPLQTSSQQYNLTYNPYHH